MSAEAPPVAMMRVGSVTPIDPECSLRLMAMPINQDEAHIYIVYAFNQGTRLVLRGKCQSGVVLCCEPPVPLQLVSSRTCHTAQQHSMQHSTCCPGP